MLNDNLKRRLSFTMAFLMLLSMMPVQVFAAEIESHEYQHDPEAAEVAELAVVSEVPETTIALEAESKSLFESGSVKPTSDTQDAGETTIPTENTSPSVDTTVPTEETTTPLEEAEEEDTLSKLQKEMDGILLTYLNATILTESEVIDIVSAMSWDKMDSALSDISNLEALVTVLTEEEISRLEENYTGSNTIDYFYEAMQLARTPVVFATTAHTYTPTADGKLTVAVSGATDTFTNDSGQIVIQAVGSKPLFGLIGGSQKTATITITNNYDTSAKLQFAWETRDANSFMINDVSYSGKNTYTVNELASKGTVTLKLTTAKNETTNQLFLSSFSLTQLGVSHNITVQPGSMGTIKANGAEVTQETISAVDADGISLSATPATGKTFVCWMDVANGNALVSTEKNFTLIPEKSMTIQALFIDSTTTPWFLVNNTTMYQGFQTAADAAESAGSGSFFALMHDATLASGNYEVHAGTTFLVPFNAERSLYRAHPDYVSSLKKQNAYRTLTMASGAHITVNGEISLSAKHSYAQGSNASPSGDVSWIKMHENSSITVKKGGFLYAWGFITGSGSVSIEDGGTVYENFQVSDWRGGSETVTMYTNRDKYKVFPMSQYYIQNIEVPMTLAVGATEAGVMTVNITGAGIVSPSVPFIGSTGMFRLSSGSITKWYDGNTDRLIVEVNGKLAVSSMNIFLCAYDILGIGVATDIYLNSSEYVLPLNNNITVNVYDEAEISIEQNLSLLPGSVMNIEKGGSITIANGYSVYVYDNDQWGGFVAPGSVKVKPLTYAPGRVNTRSESDLKDAEIKVNGMLTATAGKLYTTAGGANIYSTKNGQINTIAGTAGTTYQRDQAAKNWTSISYTPAKLKHENGTYLETASATETTTYNYDHHNCTHGDSATHGKWYAGTHTVTWDITTAAKLDAMPVETGTCTCVHADTRQEIQSAQIGDTKYDTLKAALSAAESMDPYPTIPTIALLTNFTNDTVTVSQLVTIDKGNYSVTIAPGEGYKAVEDGTSVTIRKSPFDICATNVAVADSLKLYFYVRKCDLEGTGYYAVITRSYFDKNGNPATEVSDPIPYTGWTEYSEKKGGPKNLMRFSYAGIAAKEMTDNVSVTIYNSSDKTPASTVYNESIENYALKVLADNATKTDALSQKLKTALVDMLNYGASAQQTFNYNISDLADSSAYSSYATKNVATCNSYQEAGEMLAGVTVSARNELMFTFYYNIAGRTDGMYAIITYTDYDGNAESKRVEAVDFYNRSAGLYGVDVLGMSIVDGRQVMTCTLYDANGTVLADSISMDSVEGYASRKSNGENDVYEQLMKFVDSARAYFKQLKSENSN